VRERRNWARRKRYQRQRMRNLFKDALLRADLGTRPCPLPG
jgi:hypothetical protein